MRWCLGRFQGSVSPGDEQQVELSSDEALSKGFFLGPDTSSMVWMGSKRLIESDVSHFNKETKVN